MSKIAWIAVAGGLGTIARYGLAGLIQNRAGTGFPWGTFAVNAAGCLLFGFVLAAAESRLTLSAETRAALFVGFLGAFTTFSTFTFEIGQLLRDERFLRATNYFLAQNVLGILLLFAGFALGRSLSA